MKIFTPERIPKEGYVRISARIEIDTPLPNLPQSLWYEVPEHYANFLDPGLDSFTTSLLQFAMALGEDIHVEGTLSPLLSYHLERFQQIFSLWFPRLQQPVSIHCKGYELDTSIPLGEYAATLFSGGVDSFYTLFQNLPGRSLLPVNQLTHGIFIFFNKRNHNREYYNESADRFEALFNSLGLDLIRVSTNMRLFSRAAGYQQATRWVNMTFGSGLASVGMALSRGLSWLYIPSGNPVSYVKPDGSSLVTDHLLSTERLEVVHHGVVESRGKKMEVVADFPETYDLLNVCWWETNAIQNCGVCPKCVRNMAYLEIFDRLDRYSVFPQKSWLKRLKWFPQIGEGKYTPEIRTLAFEHRKWGLAALAHIGLMAAWIGLRVRGAIRWFNPSFRNLS